jgi:hypothetical protein
MQRAFEAIHLLAKRRKFIKSIPGAEALIFGIAMAILGYFYQCNPVQIKASYYGAYQKLLGKI